MFLTDFMRPSISLDRKIDVNDDETWADRFLADPKPKGENIVEEKDNIRVVGKALGFLTERQRQVVSLYYGLEDREIKTLTTVGKKLGISRERVRQIKNNALRLLRRVAILQEVRS